MNCVTSSECHIICTTSGGLHSLRLLFSDDDANAGDVFLAFIQLLRGNLLEDVRLHTVDAHFQTAVISTFLFLSGIQDSPSVPTLWPADHMEKVQTAMPSYVEIYSRLKSINFTWEHFRTESIFTLAVLMDIQGKGYVCWDDFLRFAETLLGSSFASIDSSMSSNVANMEECLLDWRLSFDSIVDRHKISFEVEVQQSIRAMGKVAKSSGLEPLSMLIYFGDCQKWKISPAALFMLFVQLNNAYKQKETQRLERERKLRTIADLTHEGDGLVVALPIPATAAAIAPTTTADLSPSLPAMSPIVSSENDERVRFSVSSSSNAATEHSVPHRPADPRTITVGDLNPDSAVATDSHSESSTSNGETPLMPTADVTGVCVVGMADVASLVAAPVAPVALVNCKEDLRHHDRAEFEAR